MIRALALAAVIAACGATPPVAAPAASPAATPPSSGRAATPPSSGPAATAPPAPSPSPAPARPDGLAACPPLATPLWSVIPMEPGDFLAFRPLGWMSPPTHIIPAKHGNFALARPGEAPPVRPVRAPAAVTVTELVASEFLATGKTGWQVYFQPCREVRAYFYHLSQLSDRLGAEYARATPACGAPYDAGGGSMVRLCRARVQLAVAAGELVGRSGDAAGVDFGMVDQRIARLAFASASRYSDELLHYVSPVPYFAEPERAALVARLGRYDGTRPRVADPRWGEFAQDVAGTAQGNWFRPGVSFAVPQPVEDGFIALAHDYVDPSEPVFSFGGAVAGVRPGVRGFVPRAAGVVDRDFSAVRPGAIHCYEPSRTGHTAGGIPLSPFAGAILLELTAPDRLRLEARPGASCAAALASGFGPAALAFER